MMLGVLVVLKLYFTRQLEVTLITYNFCVVLCDMLLKRLVGCFDGRALRTLNHQFVPVDFPSVPRHTLVG